MHGRVNSLWRKRGEIWHTVVTAPQQLSMCVCWYLDVLLDLVSALLMTSEGADCRLCARVFIFCTVRERERWVRDITLRHCFRFGTTRNGYRDGRQSTQSALLWAGCLAVVDAGNTGLTEKGRKRLIGEVTAVKKEGKEETSEMEADRKISDSETEKMAGAGKYIIGVWCLWWFTYSHCGTINGALTHRSMTGIFMSATAISFKPTACQNLVSSQYLPLLLPHDVHYSDSIRGRQEIIKVATQIK